MAKKNGRLMTDLELVAITGWSLKKLAAVYQSTSWKKISCGDADKFLNACGLKWSTQRRQRWLIARAIKNGGLTIMRHLNPQFHRSGTRSMQLKNRLKLIEKLYAKQEEE